MSKKLSITICTGTLCYVMGGAELQVLEEYLSPDVVDMIEISGSPCLDCCNQDGAGKAPFVKIGDQIISEASISKVVDAIKKELNVE